jgi:dolichol-phosphate mannosyltransferase
MYPLDSSDYEVIAVDDGSVDASLAELQAELRARPNLVVVELRRNFGQTAAIMAGIDASRGRVLVGLDADLQNQPEDIPLLLAKIREGYDVVSGWRRERKDARLRRNLTSRVANRLISRISGVALHDYGCTLKAYRREVLDGVRLYGEMHRFIPIYAHWMGARIVEVPVRHAARNAGKSKYGMNRVFKVILDLMTVKFFDRYITKPIYVFGSFAAIAFAVSVLVIGTSLFLKYFRGTSMIQTPLPLLAGIFLVSGMMSLLLGLLAEIVVRIYFESGGRESYAVRAVRRSAPAG